METILYGKNLCNILVCGIIEEYNDIEINHKTKITLTNVNQFIVLRGTTSIKNPLNYSNLLNSYIERFSDINFNFNVIDLISYNSPPESDFLNIKINHDFSIYRPEYITELKNQGKFDVINNTIYHNNNLLLNELKNITDFRDYEDLLVSDFGTYTSDLLYGQDLNSSKVYELFLMYISHNLFEKQLCKDITYEITFKGILSNLDWETMSFNIKSNSCITSKEWLKSLILDLFDFKIESIKNHLSLKDYDFKNEILSNDRCWKIRDKTKEMIML